MEDHTTKFNNVRTQLLLQMQIDSNIQEMKERLHSTQKELHATQNELKTKENTLLTTKNELQATQSELKATQNELKATQSELKATQNELKATQNELKATQSELKATQNELQTTKVKLEQTMEELTHSKENSIKRENEMKFLKENIQKGIDNGLKMNHQITESFATYYSTPEQNKEFTKDETLDTFFNYFQIKQPVAKLIEPIEINEMKFEFLKVNELLQNLNKSYNSHEEKHETLLKKMKNGEIHHINNQQLIFKLNLPKNHRSLYIKHYNNIASLATNYAKHVVVKNDQLVLLDNPDNKNDYRIFLQIPNYNNENSHSYLYSKNENRDKLLLKYGGWNEDINMDDYKTASNKILVHVTKK